MTREPAVASTAAAASSPLTEWVRLDRARARPGPHSGSPTSRLLLAACGGVQTVTCAAAVLVSRSPVLTDRQQH